MRTSRCAHRLSPSGPPSARSFVSPPAASPSPASPTFTSNGKRPPPPANSSSATWIASPASSNTSPPIRSSLCEIEGGLGPPETYVPSRIRRRLLSRGWARGRASPPALFPNHVDVLPERVFAFFIEVDVADPHVHGGLTVGPHDLAGHRDRGIEVREIQHQVDHGADLLDARGLDANATQRDVLDAVEEQHF